MGNQHKEVEVDLSWFGVYSYSREVSNTKDKVRGSKKAYCSINKENVTDINEFVKGFVMGAVYEKGLTLDSVVFEPADTISFANTEGRPVYVHLVDDNYEIETWFREKK